jgi:alpha-2-macroglobulin
MKISKILKSKPLKIFIITLFMVVIAAISIAYILSTKHSSPSDNKNISSNNKLPNFNILPLRSDSAGVDVSSAFKISCDEAITEASIKSMLKIEPSQSFKINKVSSKEFDLSFEKDMEANKIYRFELLNTETSEKQAWAFQTQKTFKVLRTLPRDKGTSVPINTGIEISFNYENMESLDNFFEISPQAKGSFEYHKKTVVFIPEKLEANTLYTITVKKGLTLKASDLRTQEDYVFQFQTEQKSEPGQLTDSLSFSDTIYNFTSKAKPTLEIYAMEELKEKDFAVTVYKYPDEKGFISDMKKYDTLPNWAFMINSRVSFDKSNLEKVMSFTTKMVTGGDGLDWSYPHYIVLPATLPEGHYVVSSKVDNATIETHLQVNDASVYISNEG